LSYRLADAGFESRQEE